MLGRAAVPAVAAGLLLRRGARPRMESRRGRQLPAVSRTWHHRVCQPLRGQFILGIHFTAFSVRFSKLLKSLSCIVTCCLPRVAGMPSDLSRDIDECALHPDLCPHGECVDTRLYLHYLHHLSKVYLDYLLIISTLGRATTAAATQATRRQLTEAAATRTSVCR